MTEDREDASALAAAADSLTMSGAELPRLRGLPMAHKDTPTTQGAPTTYGSIIFRDFVPDVEDLVIARLNASGVVTTRKANVPRLRQDHSRSLKC